MGVGQIISDTFAIVKARFGPLLGLWAIYLAITLVLFAVLGVGMGMAGVAGLASMSEGNLLAAGIGIVLFGLLFYVGYLVLALAQYASLILLASPLKQATVGDALGAGWRAAPALLLLMIVIMIAYFVVATVFGLVVSAFSGAGEAGGVVFALVLIPVLVWLGCRLAPMFAVVAVDGVRNPFTAIARSWHLTRGHALTIFLASLVFMVILIVACGIVLLPSLGLLGGLADPAGLAEAGSVGGQAVGGIVLLMLGVLVVSVLFNIAYCAFMAVIHGLLSSAAGEGTVEAFA